MESSQDHRVNTSPRATVKTAPLLALAIADFAPPQ